MPARLSAKKLPRYSLEFKRKAVRLTQAPGMEVQAVAKGLDLNPGDAVAVGGESRDRKGRR